MNEEERITQRIGKEEPFRVPEGYFEGLTQQVMSRLPEKAVIQHTPTAWEKVKPWLYLAAMFMGIIAGAKLFVGESEPGKQPDIQLTQADVEGITDEGWQMIIEDAMLDENTFVQYFANNQ